MNNKISNIINLALSRKEPLVYLPLNKSSMLLVNFLHRQGLVTEYFCVHNKKQIVLVLVYHEGNPVISRISTKGFFPHAYNPAELYVKGTSLSGLIVLDIIGNYVSHQEAIKLGVSGSFLGVIYFLL